MATLIAHVGAVVLFAVVLAIGCAGNRMRWQSDAVAIGCGGNRMRWQSDALAIGCAGNRIYRILCPAVLLGIVDLVDLVLLVVVIALGYTDRVLF